MNGSHRRLFAMFGYGETVVEDENSEKQNLNFTFNWGTNNSPFSLLLGLHGCQNHTCKILRIHCSEWKSIINWKIVVNSNNDLVDFSGTV